MIQGSIVKTFKSTFHTVLGFAMPSNTHQTVNDMGLDSLDALDLIMALETNFKVRFTNTDLLYSSATLCDIFKFLLDTLVDAKQITQDEADMEYKLFAAVPKQAVLKTSPKQTAKPNDAMVSIPKSVFDECIKALGNKTQLVAKLKQYQR